MPLHFVLALVIFVPIWVSGTRFDSRAPPRRQSDDRTFLELGGCRKVLGEAVESDELLHRHRGRGRGPEDPDKDRRRVVILSPDEISSVDHPSELGVKVRDANETTGDGLKRAHFFDLRLRLRLRRPFCWGRYFS